MRRTRQRGVTLLLAVLVLAILIALVGQMTVTSGHHRSVAGAELADLQNSYGARAGYEQALLFLQADKERTNKPDTLHEDWAKPRSIPIHEGATTVWVQIHDVERKLNLSLIVDDAGQRDAEHLSRLNRLAKNLSIDPRVVERIADYMDKDVQGEYEAKARNARLYNLEELLRIPDLPREALFGNEEEKKKGILEFVTLWPAKSGSNAGQININTAPLEALMALDDKVTFEIAQNIIDARDQRKEDGSYKDFADPQELQDVPGVKGEVFDKIQPKVTVKSTVFEIYVRSLTGALEKAWLFVADRSGDPPKLIASMLQTDFLWVREPEEEK